MPLDFAIVHVTAKPFGRVPTPLGLVTTTVRGQGVALFEILSLTLSSPSPITTNPETSIPVPKETSVVPVNLSPFTVTLRLAPTFPVEGVTLFGTAIGSSFFLKSDGEFELDESLICVVQTRELEYLFQPCLKWRPFTQKICRRLNSQSSVKLFI